MTMCKALKKERQRRQRIRYYLRWKKKHPSHLQKTRAKDPKGKGHRFKIDMETYGLRCAICGEPR